MYAVRLWVERVWTMWVEWVWTMWVEWMWTMDNVGGVGVDTASVEFGLQIG